MGRKKNPGYWECRHEYNRTTPVCRHCGKRNVAGDHKMCFPQTPEGKALAAQREQERQENAQFCRDREGWDHPDAAKEKAILLDKYGERPSSIKDYWKR